MVKISDSQSCQTRYNTFCLVTMSRITMVTFATLLVIMTMLVPPTLGGYTDQYGNSMHRFQNPRGNQRLHPANHVQNFGYGRYSDRYRDRTDDNDGVNGCTHDYNRHVDYPRVLLRRVVMVRRAIRWSWCNLISDESLDYYEMRSTNWKTLHRSSIRYLLMCNVRNKSYTLKNHMIIASIGTVTQTFSTLHSNSITQTHENSWGWEIWSASSKQKCERLPALLLSQHQLFSCVW